jgi:hypothetical protein
MGYFTQPTMDIIDIIGMQSGYNEDVATNKNLWNCWGYYKELMENHM